MRQELSRELPLDNLDFAAGSEDRSLRLFADGIDLQCNGLIDRSVTENLDGLIDGADEAFVKKNLRGKVRGCGSGEALEIHDLSVARELGLEALLRNAAMDRHLAAFESDATGLSALTGAGAFLTTTGSRAPAGAGTASDTLAPFAAGSLTGIESIQFHLKSPRP